MSVNQTNSSSPFHPNPLKESLMRSVVHVVVIGTVALALARCATKIPPKLQVRDTASGRTYMDSHVSVLGNGIP